MNVALYEIVRLLSSAVPFVGMCANNSHISRKVEYICVEGHIACYYTKNFSPSKNCYFTFI